MCTSGQPLRADENWSVRKDFFFFFLPSLTLSFLHMCLVFLDISSYLPASIFLSPLYEFLFSTLFSFSLKDSFATLHRELNSFCRKGSKARTSNVKAFDATW